MTKKEKIDVLDKTIQIVKSNNFGRLSGKINGLCAANATLIHDRVITSFQYDYLYNLILEKSLKMTPKEAKKLRGYCWVKGNKAPRIKWLEQQKRRVVEGCV